MPRCSTGCPYPGHTGNTVGLLDFEDLAELFCPLDEAFLVLDYRLGRTDSAEFGEFAPAVIEFLDGKAFEGGETMETFEHELDNRYRVDF